MEIWIGKLMMQIASLVIKKTPTMFQQKKKKRKNTNEINFSFFWENCSEVLLNHSCSYKYGFKYTFKQKKSLALNAIFKIPIFYIENKIRKKNFFWKLSFVDTFKGPKTTFDL